MVAIGRIAKVFGIKGEVKFQSFARSLEELAGLEEVLVGSSEEEAIPGEIAEVRRRGDDLYIKFRGKDDRDAVEALIGRFVFVSASNRKPLASGEYFVDDIVGLEVFSADKKRLGVVKEVVAYPAHDMYVVNTGRNEVMVPAVKKIIKAVDMRTRTLIIDPPEGLFGETAS